MAKKDMDKTYPQRCSTCDRIGYMDDSDTDEWICRYCGALNKYIPGSRFISNGSLPYVECMCGCKIPINRRQQGEIKCPNCCVTLHIRHTQLHIAGQKASEVLDVLKGYVDAINDSETTTSSPSQNVSVSGGNVQINISNNDAKLTAQQILYSEESEKGE